MNGYGQYYRTGNMVPPQRPQPVLQGQVPANMGNKTGSLSPQYVQQMQQMQRMQAMQQRMQFQQQQQPQQPHQPQQHGMKPMNPNHKMQGQWGQRPQQQHQHGINAKDADSAESAEIAENMNRKWTNSSEHSLASKMHSALITLLESGSVMTKFPSIHTSTPNHLVELDAMKSKPKLVRISADWQTIEFHNVKRNGKGANVVSTHKPPKVLPIGNMKRVESSFANVSSPSLVADKNRRVFSKKKHSKNLWIYALDKTGKEIVIKLVCETVNDTKRWTRALTQIVSHFKL